MSTVDRPHDVLQVVRDCSEIIENCVRENKLTVGRLGMILVRVVKHDEPGQVLIDRFCAKWARDPDSTDAPFRHSVDFQLHNHKRYSPKNLGFQINSWVRCKSGNLVADQSRILIFEQDLNSLAEELNDRRFSADDIRAYCETAVVEAQSILELYFGRDHDI
ncbi:MAG: hypothetical protein HY000_41755 [Planctomycetes bacterium]|nr:hypothetical protein [Planctomycetota bacterium]